MVLRWCLDGLFVSIPRYFFVVIINLFPLFYFSPFTCCCSFFTVLPTAGGVKRKVEEPKGKAGKGGKVRASIEFSLIHWLIHWFD